MLSESDFSKLLGVFSSYLPFIFALKDNKKESDHCLVSM